MNLLPMTKAELLRSKTGNSIIVVLIALAVGIGISISVQERAVRKGSTEAAAPFDLIITPPGDPMRNLLATVFLRPSTGMSLLDPEILQEIDSDSRVAEWSPIGYGDYHEGIPIIGIKPGIETQWGEKPLIAGKNFQKQQDAVIGAHVPLNIGDQFSPEHGIAQIGLISNDDLQRHNAVMYTVVGKMPAWNSPWDDAIFVPIESVWELHSKPNHSHIGLQEECSICAAAPNYIKGGFGPSPAIILNVKKISTAYTLRSEYINKIDTNAFFPAEILMELYNLLGDASAVLSIITTIVEFLVLAAILLAVLSALMNRQKDLILLRALGASRKYIFALVWLNTLILITSGVILGLFVGWLASGIISTILQAQSGIVMQAKITLAEFTKILILIIAGALFSLIPSVMSYKQAISTSLKHF